ncbi:MAG: biopolymer transporter ExbD [Gammaproteobacteria bacterium]|nr:MAG: biopolymer transporter ExbD [Gammaproteobacteria bacterium]UCH39067.1 MAG: biopolymer transporter ExbD [Gammaproteobacteria bacterium]
MKASRRAKRMQLHHKRSQRRSAALNMVSLMDIFTILVFFLLVNATSTEVLPSPKNIVLPEAAAEKLPKRNLVIAVDEQVIRLQGKPIVRVKDALKGDKNSIQPLYNALRLASAEVKDITDKKGVTIMGDQEIPYELLKKIMLTCAGANYTNISFAVNQKATET